MYLTHASLRAGEGGVFFYQSASRTSGKTDDRAFLVGLWRACRPLNLPNMARVRERCQQRRHRVSVRDKAPG